jgi:hypothetical protein
MEIFRTDGGGKSETDERLSKVLVQFCKLEPKKLTKIKSIRDHKGTLMIDLVDRSEVDLYYHLFSYLWYKQCEYLVSIYVDGICLMGFDEGGKYHG